MSETEPVTLITGTSRGIGRHLVEHFAARGHRVIGCSRGAFPGNVEGYTHVEADVTDEADVKKVFKRVRADFGRLDNLINNAGIASMNHSLLTPTSTVEKLLATNTVAPFAFSREAAKLMQKARYGRIVNLSTVAVPLKLEGEAAYVASKAAVEALTQVMARELAEFGITVNAVGPVPVETDLIAGVGRDKIDCLVARQAVHRLGTCEDVANVVDFYLSEASDLVTGQTIYLGGV